MEAFSKETHSQGHLSTGFLSRHHGLGTLVNHAGEGDNPLHAHLQPIFETATFRFPDVATGAAIEEGRQPGYIYTRLSNPNALLMARKIALLEGLDLLHAQPKAEPDDLVTGQLFASGMAAISAAILSRAHAGDTILAQHSLYGNAFNFLQDVLPRLGIEVVWVTDTGEAGWQAAFAAHPQAVLAYTETPANPTMLVVDLEMVANLAHRYGAWLVVDNTFATPFCQRPLSLGADLVLHSTTKYLSGQGAIIGGALVSPHVEFMRREVHEQLVLMGAVPSPFDAWLANLGLKTFELRMQRHCANALQIARFLSEHPKVARVYYPGLESDPGHALARRQMHAYGGMLSFELKGGVPAGAKLMDSLRLITLAVSLGNVDSLIQHPASMTHSTVPPEARRKMGLADGLVRFSVGIENVEDLIADLEQGLAQVKT